jgi:hypothetical protein
MRSKSIFRIIASLVMFFPMQFTFAQNMKADTLKEVVIRSNSLVTKTVANSFTQDFKGVIGPRWCIMDKNYLVKFISKDQKNNALYNKKGSLLYHITYMRGHDLPAEIRGLVNDKYSDEMILTAIHVEQDARDIWVVNMKSGNDWILARVEDEQVDEVQRLTDPSI